MAEEQQDPPGDNEAEVKEFFGKFDGDGSGNINPDEFRQLLDELSPGMEDDEVEGALEELDGDGDGEISFLEFSTWWKSMCAAQAPSADPDGSSAEVKNLETVAAPVREKLADRCGGLRPRGCRAARCCAVHC